MAGRPKGVPNKNRDALLRILQSQYPDYHPVMEMAHIANDQENDVQTRFNAHKEIAQYVTPKLKAVEVTTSGGPVSIEIKKYEYAPDTK